MNASITRNVDELPESEKQSLEHLLGAPLTSNQKIHIVAYTPGQVPDYEARDRAAGEVHRILDRGAECARQQEVSESEIDEAVDEAMRMVRRRNDP